MAFLVSDENLKGESLLGKGYLLLLLLLLSLAFPGTAAGDEPVLVGLSTAGPELRETKADSAALQGLTKALLAGRSFDVLSPDVLKSTLRELRKKTSRGLDKEGLSRLTEEHDLDLLLVYEPGLKVQRTSGSQDVATLTLKARIVDGRNGAVIQKKNAEWTFTISKKNKDPANSLIVEKAMRKTGKALGDALLNTEEVMNLFLTLG